MVARTRGQMLNSLIKLIIKVWLVAGYFYITVGLTLWMVLAFLILAWPVLLVVGYTWTWIATLNSVLKLITVLGSSVYRKAFTGKKRAGRVGPWASRLPEVNTSIHLNF